MGHNTLYDNENFYLRAVEEKDLYWLAELRNHKDTWPYLGTLNFTNMPRQKRWFETSSLDPKQMNLVFGSYQFGDLGLAKIDEIDYRNGSCRVGADIMPAFRGKGLSRELYKLLFQFIFNELRMHRAWLLVMCFNARAQALYKKMGMKEEGKQKDAIFRNGKYYDYIMMSILEPEYRTWVAGQTVTV